MQSIVGARCLPILPLWRVVLISLTVVRFSTYIIDFIGNRVDGDPTTAEWFLYSYLCLSHGIQFDEYLRKVCEHFLRAIKNFDEVVCKRRYCHLLQNVGGLSISSLPAVEKILEAFFDVLGDHL